MTEVRSFGISDALILMAGIGAGMGLVRYNLSGDALGFLPSFLLDPGDGLTLEAAFIVFTQSCLPMLTSFVAAWTPACLLVQLKKPRSSDLRRTPGYLACLLSTVGCFLTVGTTWISWICLGIEAWNPANQNTGYIGLACVITGLLVGLGVVWAWATMLICGVWHAQPTWPDRLGRLTGVVWVHIGILSLIAVYLLVLL